MASLCPNLFAWHVASIRPSLVSQVRYRQRCSVDQAEDLVSTAIYYALRALPNYQGEATADGVRAWLKGVLLRVVLHQFRDQQRQVATVALTEAEVIPSPSPDIDIRRRAQALVAQLPEKYRPAVRLHLDGYTQAEISQKLHMHRNTVSRRLTAAEELLRTHFGDIGEIDAAFFYHYSRATIYHKPTAVWRPWTQNHPPDRRPKRSSSLSIRM